MKAQSLRADYKRLLTKYQGLGKGNVRLTESTLVLIQPISTTKTAYTFPVLENEQQGGLAPLPEEIRLNINDEFIVGSVGIYLYGKKDLDAQETTIIQKFWFTYAPQELNTAFRGLGDLYSGFLSVAVNKTTYVDKWDTKKHNYIPQTQWENFLAGATGHKGTQAQADYSDNGVYPCQPNFVLSGAKKNDIQISLPNAITPASGTFLSQDNVLEKITIDKILICFRGLLAQNGATFQK